MAWLYIMQSNGLYKIGISKDPKRRLKSIQRTHKANTRLYANVRTFYAYEVEQWLHKKLSHKNEPQDGNGGTEWFRLTLLDRIMLLCLFTAIKTAYILAYIFLIFTITMLCISYSLS